MAFFKHATDDKESEQLHELAKERLYSILGELTINKEMRSEDPQINSWQFLTLRLILDMEKSHKGDLTNPLDEGLEKTKNEAISSLTEISKSNTSQSWGLSTLLSMCLIQLYAGETDSISVIEELCEFAKDENSSMVGITEILLSLLAQKKALLKKLSLIIWQQFIGDVGLKELQILLDVLKTRENKQGFALLFEGEGEFEEVDEEESAVEDESKSESESDSDSESNDDEERDEEDEANEDVVNIDKEATSALIKALNLPDNIVNDKGEVDMDQLEGISDDGDGGDDDEDEESMDDEKMMELDDQLSEIFKRRKEALSSISTGNQRKVEVKESRENVIAFKHRIVDMSVSYTHLDVYKRQKEANITKSLCLIEVFQFGILKSFHIIDDKNDTPLKFSDERLIHELRFKPFNSIGVPELPEHNAFQKSLKDFTIDQEGPSFDTRLKVLTSSIEEEVQNVNTSIDEIISCIKAGDNNGVLVTGTRLVQELSLEYYSKLKLTSKAIVVNSKVIISTLKKNTEHKDYKVELVHATEGWNYYPIQTLRVKENRRK